MMGSAKRPACNVQEDPQRLLLGPERLRLDHPERGKGQQNSIRVMKRRYIKILIMFIILLSDKKNYIYSPFHKDG